MQMQNDQSSFKMTQDYEIVTLKKGIAYPIPKVEWDYLKERIKKIDDVVNYYHTAGAIILGFSGSAFLNLFISDFPKAQDGSLSNRYVICLAIAIFTLCIGFMAFFFGKKQRELQTMKSGDVIEQMDVIEERFISGTSILEIINAFYGTEEENIDVTAELVKLVSGNKLETIVSNDIKGDPVPGTRKKLIIEYNFNGITMKKECNEGDKVIIP
jgi:hypothetical protein